MSDGKLAIGSHHVAGGVGQNVRQVGAEEEIHGLHAAYKREIPNQPAHTLVDSGIDVMNELVVADREAGTGLAGVGGQPGLLTENGSRLSPDTEVLTLAVAIQAFLAGKFGRLTVKELPRDWHGGIIAKVEKSPEFSEEGMGRIAVGGEPASSGKG